MSLRFALLGLTLVYTLAAPAWAQPSLPAPEVGIDQRLDAPVPLDVTLRDEQGRAVALGQYFGDRPVLLFLGYYRCPRTCSLALNTLAEGLRRIDYQLGKDFTVVTVSIDPRETAELAAAKKAAHVAHFAPSGAEVGWHFLTGDEPALRSLASAVGFRYAYDAQRDEYLHASGVIVLTAQGKVSRYLLGLQYQPRDLAFALEDASAGKIGSPVTVPLRLLCFTYDPATGRYTLSALRLVRVVSVAAVLLLGLFLLRTWRRERRRADQPLTTAG